MGHVLITSRKQPVEIGQQLGRGGEGAVFEVNGLPHQVAKLYHKPLEAEKQAKLVFMTSVADTELLKYVAWPQVTLHDPRTRQVVGFLMPRVPRCDPVHMLYRPANRKAQFPDAKWDFLVYVARNTAAAFKAVHAHGDVIGDVNENSVTVAGDSRVILIDSDSFQVNARGTMHLCEVGVPFFTPPELQGASSFRGIIRTANHDNFGLALLIFHTLMGGRHPYAGVPARGLDNDSLEQDIQKFRYAYARDHAMRGVSPPPRSIPTSILPDGVEAMFQLAFTEKGASGGRPTPAQWMSALDALRTTLKKCTKSGMHVYPGHLKACPWCALEQQGVVYFLDLGASYVQSASSGFVMARVWALIEQVRPPPAPTIPVPDALRTNGAPLPPGSNPQWTIGIVRLIVLVVAIGIVAAAPQAWFAGAIVGIGGWLLAGRIGSSALYDERVKRDARINYAQQHFDQLVERANTQAGPKGFANKRVELEKLKLEWEALGNAEQQELARLRDNARDRQKEQFLETFLIARASITGIGDGRKTMLRSFGIETAADVTKNRVMQVHGFGHGLTGELLKWRAVCERKFRFDSTRAVSPRDQQAIHAKYLTRRRVLEQALSAGPIELDRFRRTATIQLASLKAELDAAAQALAQAKADRAMLS